MPGTQGQRFELRDHTADIAVEAAGDSIADVFAAVANGLAAASCDDIPDAGDRFSLSVTAEGREALLFDYLDELIYLRDVRGELPVDHRVERIDRPTRDCASDDGPPVDDTDRDDSTDGDEWSLEASARGLPLEEIAAREVKAVTYSEMRLERLEEGDWAAYVVFDV